jgi:hypothetical protein
VSRLLTKLDLNNRVQIAILVHNAGLVCNSQVAREAGATRIPTGHGSRRGRADGAQP